MNKATRIIGIDESGDMHIVDLEQGEEYDTTQWQESERFHSRDMKAELAQRDLHFVPAEACEELLVMCDEITPELWKIVDTMDGMFSHGTAKYKKQVMGGLPPLAKYYVLKHCTNTIQSSVVIALYKQLPGYMVSMLEENEDES